MDASRWEQLKQLLDLALGKEPAERGAFLDEACAGDESLCAEVESLLAVYQEAGATGRGPIKFSADKAGFTVTGHKSYDATGQMLKRSCGYSNDPLPPTNNLY